MRGALVLPNPIGLSRRALAALGRPVLLGALAATRVAGFSAAIVFHAMRASTWRRTVRTAFGREMREAGVDALPAVIVAGTLVGIGLVGQALYWLQATGQTGLIASILRTVLIREIAPLVVGLILVGRSGIGALIELGALRAGGQLRMLESQGIDPFHLLVVPRALATAVSGFCLTMIFILTSLLAGFVAASLIGTLQTSLPEFADRMAAGLGPSTFALVALKSLAIGFAVATACCYSALSSRGDAAQTVTGGFMRALIAVLVVSGAFSMVL